MIPEVNPYNNYRGDGVATLFDYDFFIQNGSQLIVEHIDENDVVTRLEENIDYEIVVIEEKFAGYVKFPIEDSKFGILQENETLSLQLTLPFEQISEYGQSSLLDLNSIEFSYDYLTRLCQILKRQMERAVKVNEGSEATPEQLLETINNNAIVTTNAAALASEKADEAMESANVAINVSEEIDIRINGFNESYEEMIEDITQEGEKQLQNIQSTGFYMRDDKLYFINSKGEEEEFKSGGSSYNLGDTKITDHILEGDEAEGMALQGTYVSGALYPDFYNKWLEQYRNSQAITTYAPQDMSFIGSVTNNDNIVGNFSTSNYIKIEKNLLATISTANRFEIVTKITTGSDVTTAQEVIVQGVSESVKGYNAVGIQVRDNKFRALYSYDSSNQASIGTYTVQPNTTYYLKSEFTGSVVNLYYALEKDNWILDATKATTTKLETSTYDLTIGAWRTNNTTPVRPFLGTVDLKETYIKVDGEDWFIPLATETYYQNANKRRFYPIADKPKYDEMYETYGIADFYGIDEENERIFLPRNKYFFQLTDDVSKVNNMVEAGLPNLAGTISATHSNVEWSGVFKRTNNIDVLAGGTTGYGCASGTFNASDFNPIYGNSDTVQPPSSLKLLYYCVGNTVVNDSEINAGALVAEMEQKANIFLDNTLPSQEFKNQSMLWGLPDYENAIVVKTGANNNTNTFYYTAPSNGLFSATANSSGATRATATITVNGNKVGANYNVGTSGYNPAASMIAPVSKGDEIAYVVGGSSSVYVQFIPLKGAN